MTGCNTQELRFVKSFIEALKKELPFAFRKTNKILTKKQRQQFFELVKQLRLEEPLGFRGKND